MELEKKLRHTNKLLEELKQGRTIFGVIGNSVGNTLSNYKTLGIVAVGGTTVGWALGITSAVLAFDKIRSGLLPLAVYLAHTFIPFYNFTDSSISSLLHQHSPKL